MPLLEKSTIQQRNTTPHTSQTLPYAIREQLVSIFEDQDESPDLDFAIARLMSNADSGATAKASKLVSKILGNILSHPTEQKYQTLRLMTSAAQTKLLPVTGAMDVLAAAGFVLVDVAGEDPSLLFVSGTKGNAEKLENAAQAIAIAISRYSTS
tara:strand:+ start:337 stop:798 length:462 start_codon:yes stop_codon:yes gene_type:complete